MQDCCRNFSFASGMEQRNEAASDHASMLTCSFLFRALARLKPPAGPMETAMERAREKEREREREREKNSRAHHLMNLTKAPAPS